MKAGIYSIQEFMKQLRPAGIVAKTTSRTDPSSLSGNNSDPTRVGGSGLGTVRQVQCHEYSGWGPSTVNMDSGDFHDHTFGDVLPKKVSETFRFAFQNVGHFVASSADPRNRMARIAFLQLQFDCWAWAETNSR
jgi:hypothetical protein